MEVNKTHSKIFLKSGFANVFMRKEMYSTRVTVGFKDTDSVFWLRNTTKQLKMNITFNFNFAHWPSDR